MNVFLWAVAALLAIAFLAAGLTKLTKSREQLAESGMAWVEDFSPGAIRTIAGLEVLGAIGLVLPAVFDVAPVLVPLAALGLALTMAGAAVVHARRKETQMIMVNLVLLVLAAVVAWGRFGPSSFTS